MNKKTLIAASIGLAFFGTSALAAVGDPTETVNIDWDGSGGFDDVGSLDWAVGSSFSDDSIGIGSWEDAAGNTYTAAEANAFVLANPGSAVTCVSGCSFDLYTHAALAGYADGGGNPRGISGLNADFEWTFIFGGSEDRDTLSASISDTGETLNGASILTASTTTDFVMSGSGNTAAEGFFFEIYYDTNVNADSLSGLGYSDGTKILEATDLTFIAGSFESGAFNFIDANGNGAFDPGEVALTADITADSGNDIGSPWLSLDSFGGNDWNDGDATDGAECDTNANANTDGNCQSVQGTGGTQLEALVNGSTLDSDFFDPANFPLSFISDLVFSTQNVDPFLQSNPSGSYDTSAGGATTDDNFVFGSIVNPDGTISDDVVNGSTTASNCQFAVNPLACLVDVTAGEDVLFQTDANQGFRTIREVPEPGTLALLGLSLGFLGLSRRKHRV